jgi:Transposase IS116/IS110/IS902 family
VGHRRRAAFSLKQRIVHAVLSRFALEHPEVRRPSTIRGVDATVVLAIVGTIGDFHCFTSPQLISSLGLNPRVRQSGVQPAQHALITRAAPTPRMKLPGLDSAGECTRDDVGRSLVRREVQLPPGGVSVSQAPTWTRSSASAVNTCYRWVVGRPR